MSNEYLDALRRVMEDMKQAQDYLRKSVEQFDSPDSELFEGRMNGISWEAHKIGRMAKLAKALSRAHRGIY